ncbi:shufflon system plasmid conjugative transfer pilus tip adhesin PilV, partial [Enterobacter hormaechei]
MQVTDAQIGWGMALIGIVFVGVAYGYYADDNSYSVAAQHAIRVSEAADKYVSDNFDSIVAQSSATKAFVFDITTLKNAGYLPGSFNATNSFSQTYRGMVLQPSAQKLQTLIVTTGGVSLSTGKANKIGIRIGANGGYVESGNAMGSQGSWSEPLSKYSFNPGDGHIAIAQFFKDGVSGNDF